MKRTICLLLVLTVVAAFGFSGGQRAAVPEDAMTGTITIYTSETLTDIQQMVDGFEQANPGATVEIFRLGTTELVARLLAEMDAGSTPADVVWFADMALFEDFAADGWLLDINPPEAANIPEHFIYFDGQAYEARLIFQVVAYNTNAVTREVTSWKDLLDPAFRGRVGSASPFASGATLNQIAAVTQHPDLGWEFYEALAENDAIVTGGNGGIATGIASGEYSIGLTIDFMARAQMEQGAPVDYVYQEEGALYVPTPIGVLSSSANPELAEAFVNYILSVPGQEILLANGYLPLNRNVVLPDYFPTVADIPIIETDFQYLRQNREQLLDRFSRLFGID